MGDDNEIFSEFIPQFGKTKERTCAVSLVKTNQKILDECKSHIVTNPPTKNSKPYELQIANNSNNSQVTQKVDLVYIRRQDAGWSDVCFYMNGLPTRLMLSSSEEELYEAQLFVIEPSEQPDFEDDSIESWLNSIGIY